LFSAPFLCAPFLKGLAYSLCIQTNDLLGGNSEHSREHLHVLGLSLTAIA
jgi:hypothetical protein